jgi:hypothetical protein
MDSDDVVSAEQTQWSEICAAVRAGLAKRVESLPAMTADEIAKLVEAIDTAMTNECSAANYDEMVTSHRQTLARNGQYGS